MVPKFGNFARGDLRNRAVLSYTHLSFGTFSIYTVSSAELCVVVAADGWRAASCSVDESPHAPLPCPALGLHT